MNERQQQLLNFIIKEYVKTAKPVGSALVAEKANFDLSPATLRSEMCELEDAGYLEQLHTSGGRVPTDKAYRYFVNKLMGNQEGLSPASDDKKKIKSVIDSTDDPYELNKEVARVLSHLSDNLVITKILDDSNFFKVGLSSLFEFPEFREMDRVFEMTNLFDRFESLFEKIERDFFGELTSELDILIGQENTLDQIQDETMILAKYHLPDNLMGSLTMIGPKRMDYERNITLIKYITDELNKLAYGR